jgi:ElaB/YqjD/DUF883 family membrane-anchored ribosome-binding protein
MLRAPLSGYFQNAVNLVDQTAWPLFTGVPHFFKAFEQSISPSACESPLEPKITRTIAIFRDVMNESNYPEKEDQSGKEQLKSAAEDFKAAAAGKIEDLRQTAGEKTEQWRQAAEEKAKEASRAAEHAWSSAESKGQDWLTTGEVYVRKNPSRAVLIALGVGIIVGISLRKH